MQTGTELKNLSTTVESLNTQVETLRGAVDDNIQFIYDLDLKIKEVISKLSNTDIDNMTDEEFTQHLADGDSGEGLSTNIENLKESWQSDDHHKHESFLEYGKFVFKDIKKDLDQLEEFEREAKSMSEHAQKVQEDYFNYISSPEYKEKRRATIEKMREEAENETDPDKKRSITKILNTMESADTLRFLFDRINEVGDKEINSIKESFFDSSRSDIILDKFKTRIPKYGYNPQIYTKFFNLEEMFLPKEYHVFNNMFLFHVMRFISYTNAYSKTDTLYVSAILLNLYNLIYHRFESPEAEAKFIDVIKRFDGYLEPYREHIQKYNTTSPDHPKRIEKDKAAEEKRRAAIITALQNSGIEPDTSLDTDVLRAMLDEVIEKEKAEENKKDGLKPLAPPDEESKPAEEPKLNTAELNGEIIETHLDTNKYALKNVDTMTPDPDVLAKIEEVSQSDPEDPSDHCNVEAIDAYLDEMDKMIGAVQSGNTNDPDVKEMMESMETAGKIQKECGIACDKGGPGHRSVLQPATIESSNVYDGEDVLVKDTEPEALEVADDDPDPTDEDVSPMQVMVICPDMEFDKIPAGATGHEVLLKADFFSKVGVDVVKEKEVLQSTVYIDKYNCAYILHTDGKYGYYDLNGKSYGSPVTEDTILRLLATDSLRKYKPLVNANLIGT